MINPSTIPQRYVPLFNGLNSNIKSENKLAPEQFVPSEITEESIAYRQFAIILPFLFSGLIFELSFYLPCFIFLPMIMEVTLATQETRDIRI